ncbi:MAG: serine/threonine protein kinase [Bacilli bacterium]
MAIYLYQDVKSRSGHKIEDLIESTSGAIYEIQDRLGSGGNAVVHRCIHTGSGELYAVKFQLSLSVKRIKRFFQEIKLLQEINHEQLIRYIDRGTVCAKERNGKDLEIPFFVMELAESNLADYLECNRALLYDDYIGQFRGLAQALSILHQRAIHRDIKPENIFVQGDKWILGDLGLCKYIDTGDSLDLTDEEENIGPRYWMSPESINKKMGNDDKISKQSDVFQLCSVFWFIVTRRHPTGIVEPEDWTGPSNIYEVIHDALSHDPCKRPQDGTELCSRLSTAVLP